MLDAAAAQLPIISTNCEFGPVEILKKEKYGRLFNVGDYLKLSKLMLDKNKIKKLPKYEIEKNNLNKISKNIMSFF